MKFALLFSAASAVMLKQQNSWTPVVVASTGPLPEFHGNNGPDGINCTRPTCNGTNGPMDGHVGTACTREEPGSDIPHYNSDPEAGRPYQTTGDNTHTAPQDGSNAGVPNGINQSGNAAGTVNGVTTHTF